MKKTRLVALLCTLALGISVLSGCTDKPAGNPSSGGDNSSETGTVTAKDPVTLTWWVIGNQPANLAEGVEQLNKYTVDKIGVKIDIKVAGWDAWEDRFNTIVSTGENFDMMFMSVNNYNRFANLGALADITDIVKTASPDLYEFIPQNIWDGAKVNNKIYSVPTYKDSSITQYFVWDETYTEKYNIDYKNIDEMSELDKPLRDMKAGEGKSFYPLNLRKTEGFGGMLHGFDDLALGFIPLGVKIDDPTCKAVSVLEQPDVMEKYKLLHSWYKDGIINPDSPTAAESPKQKPFFSQQGFPGAETTWQTEEGVETYVTNPVFGPMYTTASIQGSLNGISANSKHKEEALKYLELVNTDPEVRNMFAYGVKGSDWDYTGENVVKLAEDRQWQLPAYTQGTFFTLASVEPNPADQWDAVRELNEKASASVLLGFTLDISSITSEVSNCKAVWDKYAFELRTGASNPETTIPKIMKELRASGFDVIMNEAQKQIDSFKK